MVAGDLLFVGSCAGTFYALDKRSGKVRWSYDITKDGLQTSFHGDPLVAGDLVLVGTDGGGVPNSVGHLYAFARETGQVRWKYRVDKGVSTDVLGIGSRLFAVASGTRLVCLDLKSGWVRWVVADEPSEPEKVQSHTSRIPDGPSSRAKDPDVPSHPSEDPDGRSLPPEDPDGASLDSEDRDNLPADRFPGPASVSPIVVGRRVYFATARGSVYAVNARTGKVVWKASLSAPITTDLAAAGGFLYVGTSARHLYRLRLDNGAVARDLPLNGRPFGNQIVAGGSLFVLLGEDIECCSSFAAIDLSLTHLLWQRRPPAERDGKPGTWTTFRPRWWRGLLLVGSDQGVLAALRPSDGSSVWSHAFEGKMRGIGSSAEDILYIGSVEGTLYALRPSVSRNVGLHD